MVTKLGVGPVEHSEGMEGRANASHALERRPSLRGAVANLHHQESSRNVRTCPDRDGWRNLRSALASI